MIVDDVTEFKCECGETLEWTLEPDADNPSYYGNCYECDKLYTAYARSWEVEELKDE